MKTGEKVALAAALAALGLWALYLLGKKNPPVVAAVTPPPGSNVPGNPGASATPAAPVIAGNPPVTQKKPPVLPSAGPFHNVSSPVVQSLEYLASETDTPGSGSPSDGYAGLQTTSDADDPLAPESFGDDNPAPTAINSTDDNDVVTTLDPAAISAIINDAREDVNGFAPGEEYEVFSS